MFPSQLYCPVLSHLMHKDSRVGGGAEGREGGAEGRECGAEERCKRRKERVRILLLTLGEEEGIKYK